MWRVRKGPQDLKESSARADILPGFKVKPCCKLLSIASNKVEIVNLLMSQWKKEEFRSKLVDRTLYVTIQDVYLYLKDL